MVPQSAPSLPAHGVLLLSCPDTRGIVRAVAEFIERHGGNIVVSEQHGDLLEGAFFQRVEFDLEGFALDRHEILEAFAPVRDRFGMEAKVRFTDELTAVGLLASKQPHCLVDLLSRWRSGEMQFDLKVVVANHPDHAELCEFMGVPYHYLPVAPGGKVEQELAMRSVLRDAGVDLAVMARYMQILSAEMCEEYAGRVINIHHSFLPAFIGAKPYHQAHERGVKLIGVTAHYATSDLDQGPIIEQDVMRVSHRDTPDDLVRHGRDLEMVVLARAVRAHLEHRVLVYGRRTVIFS